MKVQLLKVADVPASLHPFRNFEQPFNPPSSSRFIDTFSEVIDSGPVLTRLHNFFEISILLQVSGRWYFCKDLTSLCLVRSITNLSGIPFCSPRVAVVARRLLFVNWPPISASLHNVLTVSPSMLGPTGQFPYQSAKCIKKCRKTIFTI